MCFSEQSARRDHNCSQRPHRSRAFGMRVGAIARLVLRVLSRPMYCPNNKARQLLSALSVSFAVNKIPFEYAPGRSISFAVRCWWNARFAKNTGTLVRWSCSKHPMFASSRWMKSGTTRDVLRRGWLRGVREKKRVKGAEGRDWTKTNLTWQVLKNRIMK